MKEVDGRWTRIEVRVTRVMDRVKKGEWSIDKSLGSYREDGGFMGQVVDIFFCGDVPKKSSDSVDMSESR